MNHTEFCDSNLARRRLPFIALVAALSCLLPVTSFADEYYYVDWLSADVALGTAMGVITLPDSSTVTVTFAALNPDGSAGNLSNAQTNGGTNYWTPADPYLSAEVENAPPDSDILQLEGGQNQLYRVTLSEPIRDPVMAIVSLGQPAITTQYEFDVPFTIVSQGRGYWGGSATALAVLPSNVLQGTEGHGTIRFIGVFSTFSWTVPIPEFWHGFTFGIRTTERIEPSDAGVADAETMADATVRDAAAADGSTDLDATSRPDAIGGTDARAAPDASSPADAGVLADVGDTTEDSDGCSCDSQAAPPIARVTHWVFVALCCLWLVRRRD